MKTNINEILEKPVLNPEDAETIETLIDAIDAANPEQYVREGISCSVSGIAHALGPIVEGEHHHWMMEQIHGPAKTPWAPTEEMLQDLKSAKEEVVKEYLRILLNASQKLEELGQEGLARKMRKTWAKLLPHADQRTRAILGDHLEGMEELITGKGGFDLTKTATEFRIEDEEDTIEEFEAASDEEAIAIFEARVSQIEAERDAMMAEIEAEIYARDEEEEYLGILQMEAALQERLCEEILWESGDHRLRKDEGRYLLEEIRLNRAGHKRWEIVEILSEGEDEEAIATAKGMAANSEAGDFCPVVGSR